MRAAAEPLKGQHDFHSFETDWPNRLSSVRTITHLGVCRMGDWIWIDVEAKVASDSMVQGGSTMQGIPPIALEDLREMLKQLLVERFEGGVVDP